MKASKFPFGVPNWTQHGVKATSYQKVKIELLLQPKLTLDGCEGYKISQIGVPCGKSADELVLDGAP